MSERSFTIATTNFKSTDVKHLRYFYLVFFIKDTVNNTTLLASNKAITVILVTDDGNEETYSFTPKSVGGHREKIPLKHTQKGVWWTVKLALEYDFICEYGECLIIPISRR